MTAKIDYNDPKFRQALSDVLRDLIENMTDERKDSLLLYDHIKDFARFDSDTNNQLSSIDSEVKHLGKKVSQVGEKVSKIEQTMATKDDLNEMVTNIANLINVKFNQFSDEIHQKLDKKEDKK